ncbi:hypothetical protein [Halomarina rubra]|uniref:SCP2 domain-containing protein n=1 Tax=Halomarina rubra TaxID=2071873 RepID=A0ABD6ARV9_9EURY|nr:hypothetical protein [Halomarina rubra]
MDDADRPTEPGESGEPSEAPSEETLTEETPERIEPAANALAPEALQYPTFEFDDGEVGEYGGFDISQAADRDRVSAWLRDLAGGLSSHDVAVETPDGHVRFGVGPKAVEMSFDPDEDCRGDLEVTFRFSAKAMFVADDPDAAAAGARGGRGFVPIEALTTDRETFHCYNWIRDPTDP